MPTPPPSAECLRLFAAKNSDAIYTTLVRGLRSRVGAGLATEDPKATCVHITAGPNGVAYAGIHPRVGAAVLTIRTATPLRSARIRKAEQVSRNRCHCELLLQSPADVDEQLLAWLEESAALVAGKASTARGSGKQTKAPKKSAKR